MKLGEAQHGEARIAGTQTAHDIQQVCKQSQLPTAQAEQAAPTWLRG